MASETEPLACGIRRSLQVDRWCPNRVQLPDSGLGLQNGLVGAQPTVWCPEVSEVKCAGRVVKQMSSRELSFLHGRPGPLLRWGLRNNTRDASQCETVRTALKRGSAESIGINSLAAIRQIMKNRSNENNLAKC